MLFLKYSRVNISKFWNSESVFDDKKWIEEKTPSEKKVEDDAWIASVLS